MSSTCLFDCRITHSRPGPPQYKFAYRAYYLFLDIDHIAEDCAQTRLLGHNRFSLLGFYDQDHGDHDTSGDGLSLRDWAQDLLTQQGVQLDGGRIRLLCLPRVLGYVFNPISIFYCEHADGGLRAIICEVHNTFGERHCYVLHADGQPMDYDQPHAKAKVFHVSPLLERAGEYRFRFTTPADKFAVSIGLYGDKDQLRIATALAGNRIELNDRNLLTLFVRIPFMTLKIMAAIYWQALKIWVRGGHFFGKPEQHSNKVS